MSWELRIWPANKSGPVQIKTQATPGGIEGGFKWQLASTGNTVQLRLTGRNDQLALPPRAVVQLVVDGGPAFYGVVPDPPSADSADAEEISVAGGAEALRVTLMDGKTYKDQGVYTIARDLLQRLCPPALAYVPTLIGNGTGTDAGPTIGTYYSPDAPLTDVLEGLAKQAGTTWGVDNQGRIFLGKPASTLVVPYAGQPWKRLAVQGRETVTQTVLRIATAPSEGVITTTQPALNEQVDYLPASVTTVATHSLHSLYRAQKAVSPPDGISLTGELRTGTVGSRDMATISNAFDGDTASLSASTGVQPYAQLTAVGVRVIGVRLRYTLSADAEGFLVLAHLSSQYLAPADYLRLPLQATDSPTDVILIGPPSTLVAGLGVASSIGQAVAMAPDGTTNVLAVYDLALLVVNEAAALALATTYLQVPYAAPAEVTLNYLASPAESVTVTGSPDGTVSGPAGLYEYEHSSQNVRTTRVRLGSTGTNELVRALRWSVGGQV